MAHLSHGIIAAGVVLHYLSETRHSQLQHIIKLQRITEDEHVWMDRFTIRNLELYQSTHTNGVTLLDVIDRTLTPMGGRMIKRWLALPLKNLQRIEQRHEVVAHLLENEELRQAFTEHLGEMGDLERLISKISTGKVNPKEVLQLRNSLLAQAPLKAIATATDCDALSMLADQLHDCSKLVAKISDTLSDSAPVQLSKGTSSQKAIPKSWTSFANWPSPVKAI